MNLKAKHTPRPWKTGEVSWNDDGDVRYTLHGNKEARFADARLIAAAPDLLEACKAAFKELGTLRDYLHITEKTTLSLTADYKRVYSALKKAIAKAEGENL